MPHVEHVPKLEKMTAITDLVVLGSTNMHYAYIPQASNWARDASMGEVCTSVLFIRTVTVNVMKLL